LDDSLIDLPERLRVWRTAGIRHLFTSCKANKAECDEQECPVPTAPELFAEPWKSYYFKIAKKPRFVFTYPDLAYDVFGKPNQDRSLMWRNLFKALNSPPGTFAFWPFTFINNDSIAPDFNHFYSGIVSLRPKIVFYFGEQDDVYLHDISNLALNANSICICLDSVTNVINNTNQSKQMVFRILKQHLQSQ